MKRPVAKEFWRRGAVFAAVLALTASLLAGCSRAPSWAEPLGYKADELHRVTIGRFGYPYVDVTIDGTRLSMAVDTGNMSGLTVAADVADRLDLPAIGQGTLRGSDGSKLSDTRVLLAEEVTALGHRWERRRVTTWQGLKVDGLFGPAYLSDRFTLDYHTRTLAVSDSPLPEPPANSTVLPMVRHSRHARFIAVMGKVNGREVLIELDTGKSRTVVDPTFAEELGLPRDGDDVRVDRIELGPFSFSAPRAKPVSFRSTSQGLPEPIALSLGSDTLSGVVMTVDFREGVVLLMPTGQ